MHRFITCFVFIGILAAACQDNAGASEANDRKNGFTPALKSKEDSLYHDVMEGHDVGMAKIGKLRKYIDQTQHSIDSLQKLPASPSNMRFKTALDSLLQHLKYADYSMNTWMEEFSVDSATGNPELRIRYLQAEKEKVTKVKENILGSLQQADSLLNKN